MVAQGIFYNFLIELFVLLKILDLSLTFFSFIAVMTINFRVYFALPVGYIKGELIFGRVGGLIWAKSVVHTYSEMYRTNSVGLYPA
jgi:hypothetical protein